MSSAGPSHRRVAAADGTGRLDSLTALRFFAALFVVVFHGWYHFTGKQGIDGAGFVNFGYTSVGFFFMLSGFVLAWSWRPGVAVWRLWWRRFARVWPLCAFLTVVVAVYFLLVPQSAPPGMPTWSSFLLCFGLLQAWPPFTYVLGYNYPSWSLSTEFFFYLCFPFIALGVARLRLRWLLSLAVLSGAAYVVAAYWVSGQQFHSFSPGSLLAFPPLQLLKFVMGVLLGTAFRRGWRPRTSALLALVVLTLVYAAMPDLVTGDGPLRVFRATELFPDLVLLVPMAYLVCAAAAGDLRGSFGLGRVRAFVVLGDWSYALYLVHAPLLMAVNELRIRTDHLAPPGFAWFAVYIAVSISVSGFLHHALERPVERRLRGLSERRERGPATNSVTLRSNVDLQKSGQRNVQAHLTRHHSR
jgi:peptidoglycan/LPS O-acetylase OafA/YrhL